jgi:O-antigen ligase
MENLMELFNLQNINKLRIENHEKFVVLANYLMVVYAFSLPIYSSVSRTLFTFILILFLLSGNIREKLFFALKNKVVKAFLLFYFIHLVWMVSSEHIDLALSKLDHYRYILYIIIYVTIIKKDFIFKILSGFILGVFFSEIVSYLMLFDIRIPFLIYTGYGANVPFLTSYTTYSMLLSMSMGILLFGIITLKQNNWLRLLYILFFISASSNIFIIQSKLGYALYSVSILTVTALIIVKYKKFYMLPVSLTLIFTGYFIAYNTSDTFHQRVNAFFNETQAAVEVQNYTTSTGTRIGFNKYGYELILKKPIFGQGTGDHIAAFLKYAKDKEPNQANYNSFYRNTNNGTNTGLHNEFLDIPLQFGIVGLLIFLNIFYQLYRYKSSEPYMKAVQIISITILLSASTIGGLWDFSKIGKIFTLLSALTLTLYYEKHNLKKKNEI